MATLNEQLAEIIGLAAFANEVKPLRYHTSSTTQTEEILRLNKYAYSEGYLLLQLCYGIHLYRRGIIDDIKTMYMQLNSYRVMLTAYNLYCVYDLEKYVIKGEGKKAHPDIAIKLLWFLYQKKGFLEAYNFVEPFFPYSNDKDKKNSLEPVIEFALKSGRPFFCQISHKDPKNGSKYFSCTISVGPNSVSGKGARAESAKKDALNLFMARYELQPAKPENIRFPVNSDPYISETRQKTLSACMDSLGILSHNLSITLIDRALTVDSIDSKVIGQGTLVEIGAIIVKMACYEYLRNSNFAGTTDDEIVRILTPENVAKPVPENCIEFLRNAPKAITSDSHKNNIKGSILQSVCAALSIDAIETGRKALFNDAYRLASNITKLCNERAQVVSSAKTNYYAVVSNILERNHMRLYNNTDWYMPKDDDKYNSKSSIRIEGNGWMETEEGTGKNSNEALNNACCRVITKLLPHFKNNAFEYEILKRYAPSLVMQNSLSANEAKINLKSPRFRVFEDAKNEDVTFVDGGETLYVCKSSLSCRRNNHKIISATGMLKAISGKLVPLNVNYCTNCKKYFISYEEYKHYREMYGAILGKLAFSTGDFVSSGFGEMAPESILRMCGYNVNQTENLTERERHAILEGIIDNNIISKYRVMEYLQFFINRSKNSYSLDVAVDRWKDDLDWVREYKLATQKKTVIKNIRK